MSAHTLETAPIGTIAPSVIGGSWQKTAHGWKANGGDTFPAPGGDWTGRLIVPPERALSLLQPWCDAILRGGKRIENRTAWKSSSFRGPVFLHASAKRSPKYHDEVWAWVVDRGVNNLHWQPNDMPDLKYGGIVGRAFVAGVIRNAREFDGWAKSSIGDPNQRHWYMGGFALVLRDVEPTPFVPCKGALGFWKVPAEVAARAMGGTR